MDFVKLCLSPFCSCIQSPVVRQDMSHVFSTKEKLDDLKNAMEQLLAKRNDIQRELDDSQHKGKLLRNELQLWLRNVGEKDNKVERLLDEYSKGNCVAGSCSLNCFSRYKISSDAIKLKEEIIQLKAEQPEIKFTDIPPPEPVPESYNIVGKTIVSNADVACSYLTTNDIIGIWGMGGVGKTTLLKKINQRLADNANMGFDHVLFIQASQNTQLEELQKEIAKKLHLPSSAGQQDIFNALKTKNIVVLLDNIWKPVDLVGLGIINPFRDDDDSTKPYKYYKVIFTTRSEDVCAQMIASKRIKVECLKPYEAWDLFKHNVNLDVIELDESINEIAKQVMYHCSGLPLALKVIGKAMSTKTNLQEWKYMLMLLQDSHTKAIGGMEQSLFPILKYSYDNLPDNIKGCFLSAAILQGKSKYELLEYWIGLDLMSDFVYLQQAYYEEESILGDLEKSCLLHFSVDGSVHLHDVIYEMAMWIASDCGVNRNKWIVKKYDGLAEISTSDTESWISANRVIIGGIKLLPILSHQCSDLLCLMILHSYCLERIPEGIFQQMPKLIFLDLSNTAIKELPKDIKCLVNLQYLNISSTEISSLPKALINLNKLRCLICRYLKGLGKVENGLMSRLQKLKIIDLYPNGWVEPDELKILKKHIKAIGMLVVSREVLQQLSCLPTTQLCIKNLDNLISLEFDTLSCKNHQSLHELEIRSCSQLEVLVMNGNETHLSNLRICDVKKLQDIIWRDILPPKFFPMLKTLVIYNCNLANFAWVLHLPCLFYLNIRDCEVVETLFYVEEGEIQPVLEGPMFPALQYLYLSCLPNLESISNFALDFPRLSRLALHECPMLISENIRSSVALTIIRE